MERVIRLLLLRGVSCAMAGATEAPLPNSRARNAPVATLLFENDYFGGQDRYFGFAGADGRAVARGLLIEGNTFLESPGVKREPFVADAFYGLGVAFRGWQLTYTEAVRSHEFRGQHKENYYGSLALSRVFQVPAFCEKISRGRTRRDAHCLKG